MVGLPVDDKIGCKLLLGLAVSVERCSNPMFVFTKSHGIRPAVAASRLSSRAAVAFKCAPENLAPLLYTAVGSAQMGEFSQSIQGTKIGIG
jgi:hypothetical protein